MKKQKMLVVAVLVLAMLLALFFIPSKTIVFVRSAMAEERPVLRPELERVCSCESSYEGTPTGTPRQFELDGSVRRGRINRADVGRCQINLFYHANDAKKMKIDLFTEDGNIEYANYLYDTQGLKPWVWSKKCWAVK